MAERFISLPGASPEGNVVGTPWGCALTTRFVSGRERPVTAPERMHSGERWRLKGVRDPSRAHSNSLSGDLGWKRPRSIWLEAVYYDFRNPGR